MNSCDKDEKYIVAISNPRSGRNKRGGFDKFTKAIARFPAIEHIVTDSENGLIAVLDACKNMQCRVLVVNGGDGTLLQILTYLKQQSNSHFNPYLVLLRAGTTSMAYGDVGCRGKLENVLAKLQTFAVHTECSLNKVERAVLRMSLPQENQIFCGMFFGGGAIYNGILYCRQRLHTKGIRGEVGPSMAMIRYLLDWLTTNRMTTSTCAKIRFESGATLEDEFTIITATTLRRLLMGVYPFWGNRHNKAGIPITLIKKYAPKPARAFIKILLGKQPDIEDGEDYYKSLHSPRIMLEMNDGFTLDGELFGGANKTSKVILESAGKVTFLTT